MVTALHLTHGGIILMHWIIIVIGSKLIIFSSGHNLGIHYRLTGLLLLAIIIMMSLMHVDGTITGWLSMFGTAKL